jgi:hypothetical protein
VTSDATRMCEVLVGLGDVPVLAVDERPGRLVVEVETTAMEDWCRACGRRVVAKDRRRVALGDLACFGRPVLVSRKRRWSCPAGRGVWTERNDVIAAPRRALTGGRGRRRPSRSAGWLGRCPASGMSARLWDGYVNAWNDLQEAIHGTRPDGPRRL